MNASLCDVSLEQAYISPNNNVYIPATCIEVIFLLDSVSGQEIGATGIIIINFQMLN